MRMANATFDLVDAPLGDSYKHIQSLPDEYRAPNYRQVFSVDPSNWRKHAPPPWISSLTWREYQYSKVRSPGALNKIIPQRQPGIYIFYARPDYLVHQFPRFAFYVGVSNERGSGRPLRERLKEYLPTALASIRKRENVHRMLRLYYDQIWVAFALSERTPRELRVAEVKLHGFVHPCYGRRDFPADVKRQQKAFGAI